MTIILKQSTQIKVRIGPFVDVGDAFTPEVGVTLTGGGDNADEAEALKANGAATADISSNTWAAVSGADGWYDLTLTTGNTDTVGELLVVIQNDSEHLPVYQRFQIIEEAIYASLYAASAAGFDANQRVNVGAWLDQAVTVSATTNLPETDAKSLSDDTQAADDLEDFVSGVSLSTPPKTDIVKLASSSTASAVLSRYMGSAAVLGTSDSGTTTTMVDAARNESDDAYKGAMIVFTSGTNARRLALITGFVAASDTITFTPALPDEVTTEQYVILPSGYASVEAWLSTAATAGTAGVPNVNATEISGDATAADNLELFTEVLENGTGLIDAGTFKAGAINANAIATSAITAAKIQTGAITSTKFASGAINSAAIATDAIGAAEFSITAVAEIVDAVWNELQSSHIGIGTFGETATEIAALQSDLDNATDGLGALKTLIDAIPTTAMRGTDNAALASVCTEARLSELDAATGGKLANVMDVIDTLTKAAGDGDLAAIKVVLDKFAFTVTNEVDANTKSINDAEVVGDGNATPWDGV